jgi:hypothetical protein
MSKRKKKQTPATSTLVLASDTAPMILVRPEEAAPEPVPTPTAPIQMPIERAQIARRAFAKWAARGYTDGHHVEDWLAAEAELRAAQRN